jgi:hypothetical protein
MRLSAREGFDMSEMEMAKRAWVDFLHAHGNECDFDAVVDTIVSGVQEITLKAVGEWLDKNKETTQSAQAFDISIDFIQSPLLNVAIEALKHGEMPE